mgnify:CR=1 FL=1
MTSLDCADPSMRVEKRNESLSAIQALALLNNGFMTTQAVEFAARVAREAGDDPRAQIDRALSEGIIAALPLTALPAAEPPHALGLAIGRAS